MDKDWPYANIDVQFLTVAAGSKYADWLSDPKSQEFFTDGYVALQADFWRIFLLSEYGGVYADMDMILLDDASLAGPDGLLYISFGDGGGGGDTFGNGQDKNNIFAALLRIDVGQPGDGELPYGIPEDNPFADGGGSPEIFAWGLRNLWRFSFDSETGEIWGADVGQRRKEEVNLIERGGNYGWPITTCKD